MKKAVKITVKGNLHGSFYRDYIREHAERLGLKGFVRNVEDGAVEVFVEGDIEDVDRMFELCRKENAPKHAVIRDIQMIEAEFQDLKEFKVLHI